MRKFIAVLILLPLLAWGQRSPTDYPPLKYDPTTGVFVPSTTNGHTIGTGDLTAYQTKAGVLALGGFSSITGRVGNANLPLGAQIYDAEVSPIIAANFGGRQLHDDAGNVVIGWSNPTQLQFFDGTSYVTDAGIFTGNGSGLTALYNLTLAANQSVRRNAGNTAYEAFTAQPIDTDLTTWAGITPGTGVGTALALNVGSAGAFVTFNGALGTPSSGNGSNLTSLYGLSLVANESVRRNTTNTAYEAFRAQEFDLDLATWAVITRASGFDTFTATPSGANLASLLTTALPVSKGGTNATSASITAFNNITGLSAAGTTGTTSTNLVFSTSPTLVTPILGTPASGTLTNCTGLPVAGLSDRSPNTDVLAFQALGSAILAQSVGTMLFSLTDGMGQTDNRVEFVAVYLPKAATLVGVKWVQSTGGSYTADGYNGVGLYSYSAGTLTLVASSTDDGNIWKGSTNTLQAKAFTSTYAAAAGLYFVALLHCQSAEVTQPKIAQMAASHPTVLNNLDFTNSVGIRMFLNSQTALPSPTQTVAGMTASAGTGNPPWVALY